MSVGPGLPANAAAPLRADARVRLAERALQYPDLIPALIHVLAELAVDKAKTVRIAAIQTLERVPLDDAGARAAAALTSVPASRAGEVVEWLSRTDEGAALLAHALAEGAKIAPLLEKADARRAALQEAAVTPVVLDLPPMPPLPEPASRETVITELRRMLDKEVAVAQHEDNPWLVKMAAKALAVSDADLRQVADVVVGATPGPAKLTKKYDPWWFVAAAPSLTMVQLLRLRVSPSGEFGPEIRGKVSEDTDLRAVEQALIEAGWVVNVHKIAELARSESWFGAVQPEAAWPWFATHFDILQAWLAGPVADQLDALRNLDGFPALPGQLMPTIAAIAMGTSRTARPKAQALLAKHGVAFDLAVQGLADGKSEIRASSASWLAGIKDAAAIAPLRAALTRERREVARAAMLSALESLGEDIRADLTPQILLTEATRGLKAKPAASLSWLNLDHVPTVTWADGTAVDPTIARWWVVLANKLGTPDGTGLIDLYLGALDPGSAADLGRWALGAWVAQDTRHPDPAESRAYADHEGPDAWRQAQEWLEYVRKHPEAAPYRSNAEAAAAIPLEQQVAAAYSQHQATYVGSATASKGLLALTTRIPGIDLVAQVQNYLRHHGSRRSQVEALTRTLAANGDPAAVQLLLSIARRFKQASVQEVAVNLVEGLADQRGWTPDELADRTIPTAGFDDDRILRLDFGPRQFLGRATPRRAIVLTTQEGKQIKSLPAPRADEDAATVKEAKATLASARQELKAVVTGQTARLYEAMAAERTWAAADWQEFLAGHPLMSTLISRLVWLEEPGLNQRAFRPADDGALLDLDDETVELSVDSRIGIAHRTLVTAETAAAWTRHLADYDVAPLFAQFQHDLPAIDAAATEITDLQGHLTDTFSLRGAATKRGYSRGSAERLAAVVRLFAQHDQEWIWPAELRDGHGLTQVQRDLAAEVALTIEQITAAGLARVEPGSADRLSRAAQRARLDDLPSLARLVAVAASALRDCAGRHDDVDEASVLAALAQGWALARSVGAGGEDTMSRHSAEQAVADGAHRGGPATIVPLAAQWWLARTGARGMTLHLWQVETGRLERVTTGRAAGADPTFHPDWNLPMVWDSSPAQLCAGPFTVTGLERREDGTLSPTTRTKVTPARSWAGMDLDVLATTVNSATGGAARVSFGADAEPVRIIRPRSSFGLGTIEVDEVAQLLIWPVTDVSGRTHRLALDATDSHADRLGWLIEQPQVLAVVVVGDRPEAAFVGPAEDPQLVSLTLTPLRLRNKGASWRRRLLKMDKERRADVPVRPPDDLHQFCSAIEDVAVALASTGQPELSSRQLDTIRRRRRDAVDLGLGTLADLLDPLERGRVEASDLLAIAFVVARLRTLLA